MPCLSQQTLRRLLALATLALLSATLALAQETSQPGNRDFAKSGTGNWSYAATIGSPHKKLFVVTIADPTHRHTCRVQSIAADQLVCKGSFNTTHFYKPQEVAALVIPGDYNLRVWMVSAANASLGAAIWATVILIPTCPPCAVATGIAALISFGVAGAALIGEGTQEHLLYLAPGQTLQVKLRY